MKMKKSIKILRIIPTIDPMYGGPSKTIIDTSLKMANKGFEIDILTGLQKKGSKVYKAKKNTSLNIIRKLINNNINSIELSGGEYEDFQCEKLKSFRNLNKKISLQVHNYFPPPKEPFVLTTL